MTEILWCFPGKAAINFRNKTCGHPNLLSFLEQVTLLESHCLSAEQSIFFPMLSVKCSGQMSFLWIWLIWPLCIYHTYSAISRDPKLLTQKINLINTNCKCIILGYKPRAIFGLEVYCTLS